MLGLVCVELVNLTLWFWKKGNCLQCLTDSLKYEEHTPSAFAWSRKYTNGKRYPDWVEVVLTVAVLTPAEGV